jgi:hypothetical protein
MGLSSQLDGGYRLICIIDTQELAIFESADVEQNVVFAIECLGIILIIATSFGGAR